MPDLKPVDTQRRIDTSSIGGCVKKYFARVFTFAKSSDTPRLEFKSIQ